MIRILWDTNVFVRAIFFQQAELLDYLDDLIFQHENNRIELIVPKAVQVELYGILRAGRLDFEKRGIKHKNYQFSHAEVVFFLGEYPMLFDPAFLDSLSLISWPRGVAYKEERLKPLLEEHHGWTDWGQSVIETRLRHSVEHLGLKDKHDYPIMAAALESGIDLLVTANLKDFIDPLGKIKVMDAHEARKFDHHSLHIDPEEYYDFSEYE